MGNTTLNRSANHFRLLGQTGSMKVFNNKQGAFKFLDGFEDDYRIKSANILGTTLNTTSLQTCKASVIASDINKH